jgi:xylulokinase
MAGKRGYLLGIDVGSTTVRCILFDLDGRPVSEAYREPQVHYPQTNWAEVDPEDWWACTAAGIGEALSQARVPGDEVAGVGLCGLKHAVVPVDVHGNPLARAMLWMDQRCRPQAQWMSGEHGELVARATGGKGAVSTTPSAPKLRWIAEHEPALLERTHKFLLAKDFVRFRLTASLATDPTDAGGTLLYDRRAGDWSPEMLALVGVPLEKMPPIHESTALAGAVVDEAARATGLAPGTPVVVGGGDVYCTLVGADALNPPEDTVPVRACLYLGTAAWLSVARPRSARGRFGADCFGATATTGAALKWLLTLSGAARPDSPSFSYAALLREAGNVPLGARGLLFLPHLMGERAPENDPDAKGVFFGLSLAHGRSDLARAVLEGCAFQLRRIAETLDLSDVEAIVVVGGGAKSALWVRMMADVMGIPLLVPRVLEAGALGAAILAGVGVGAYAENVGETARRLVQVAERVEPDLSHRESYERIYSLFLELERSVDPLYGSSW